MIKSALLKLWSLLLVAVALCSCVETPGNDETPAEITSNPLSVEITDTSAENLTAKVSIAPGEECAKYVVGVIDNDYYDENLTSEELVAEYVKEQILAKDVNFVRVDGEYVFSGDAIAHLSRTWDIEGSTTYAVVAFGVTSKGERTTKVAENFFVTDEAVAPVGDLEVVTSSITATNIKVTVNKSKTAPFKVYAVTAATDHMLQEDYDGDVNKYIKAFMDGQLKLDKDLTVSDDTYFYENSVSYNLSSVWDIEYNCDYNIIVFGIDAKGAVVGDVVHQTCRTKPFGDGYGIALEKFIPESYRISLEAMPGKSVGNYCVYAVDDAQLEEVKYNGHAFDLATLIRTHLHYSGVDITKPDGKYIFSGNKDIIIPMLKSETKYTIIAFGISQMGAINSEVTLVEKTTPKPPIITGDLASITVDKVEGDVFTLTVDKGDYTGNYYVGVYSVANFEKQCNGDERTLAEQFMEDEIYLGNDLTVVDNNWLFDKSATFDTSKAWICNYNTEYIIIAFGASGDGKVISNIVSARATTGSVKPSDNQITLSVHGINSNSATLRAQTTNDDIYYFGYMEKALADTMTDEELAYYIYDQGGQFFIYFLSKGDDSLYTTTALKPSTEYCAVAYGWDKAISTEFQRISFTTLADEPAPAIPSEITLSTAPFGTVEISNITSDSYHLEVMPTDEDMEYVHFVTSQATIAQIGDNYKLLVQAILTAMDESGADLNKGGDIYDVWGDFVKPIPTSVTQGTGVAAGYDYAMIFFGIDKATLQPTTEIVIEQFSTLPGGGFAPAKTPLKDGLSAFSPLASKWM